MAVPLERNVGQSDGLAKAIFCIMFINHFHALNYLLIVEARL